jgi:putative PEP-CTERM system histidine kinase
MEVTAPPLLHAGAMVVAFACAALILLTGRGRHALLPALVAGVVGLWSLGRVFAVPAHPTGLPLLLDLTRDLVCIALLLALTLRFRGSRARRQVQAFAAGGGLLAGLALLLAAAAPQVGSDLLARLGLTLIVLLAAENLYRNVREPLRWHVVLPAIAIGGIAAFDLLVHAEAALSGSLSGDGDAARSAIAALAMPLLLLGVLRDRRLGRDAPVSRDAVFHGATLIVAGALLTVVGVAGEALRHLGPAWAPVLRTVLLGAAGIGLVLALATASFRSRLRSLVVDHFQRLRFDYRREWQRCAGTLSTPDNEMPAGLRAIRAIADAVDAPAGVLLLRGQGSVALEWARSWNRPACTLDGDFARDFGISVAARPQVAVLDPVTPAGLRNAFGPLWLVVPLLHDRLGLTGAVLLASPRAPFLLDREAFDLLRTLAREVAMFLAEHAAAERLAEQRRVQGYARQFAFVAHDVKTVASQLSMLLANAEENIANAEFQRDMLVTVRASADRIRGLITRLSAPEDAAPATPTAADAPARLRALAASRRHPVRIEQEGVAAPVAMTPDAFDSALGHLLDNAIDASVPDQPVRIRLRWQQHRVAIDVTDRGTGMSPEFIRDELFRPLGTTKQDGSGIGTWQARELLREAGGDLTVLSRPGVGTTMRLTLATTARAEAAVLEDRA